MNRLTPNILHAGLAGLLLLTVLCADAHAYIDPGSGSHLFQVLIASLLATFYGIKVYWLKITAYLQRLFKKSGR